ncbi:hypothetical protein GCM10027563_43720 [Parasphingorhabdus pacifica]
MTVRQGEEDDVVSGQFLDGCLGQHAVGQREQIGLVLPQHAACVTARGQGSDLDFWMCQEQTEEFAARVATGTRYCHPYSHADNYAP